MIRKYRNHKLQTNWGRATKNHETPGRQKIKATSSLFAVKMTSNLESTQSNTQQNIEQLENPTMGVAINNESQL